MKHYKVPELVASNIEDFNLDKNKLTEQDFVNEANHELENIKAWEREGCAIEQYGEDYGKYRRQLTLYLARQRKRGIVPNHNYDYLDDPSKQLS